MDKPYEKPVAIFYDEEMIKKIVEAASCSSCQGRCHKGGS